MYSYISDYFLKIIPQFELEKSSSQVMNAFELICGESLAVPFDDIQPEYSRINADGLPFQFSLSIGDTPSPLQFLGEVKIPGSSNKDCILLNKERISTLARLLNMKKIMFKVNDILNQIVPVNDPDLLADPAGTFWIGVSFSIVSKPKLKIYINGNWGKANKKWMRLDSFISHFDDTANWSKVKKLLFTNMQPLGMALTLSEDDPLIGRVYMRGYGNPVVYYEKLLQSVEKGHHLKLFNRFVDILLGSERQYPTRSVVCSFSFSKDSEHDFKLELCGHCLFKSDIEAKDKCLKWLEDQNFDVTRYLYLLKLLSNNNLSNTNVDIHCFVGLGLKQEMAYSSIYLKPNLIHGRK